jgi:HSP20 family molecular chaperone IbpA
MKTNTTQILTRKTRDAELAIAGFRKPAYECHMHRDGMVVTVYIPGVDANSVTIEARGADLVVTALKERFVRVNFTALNLESAQSDYRLCLRLGKGYAFESMNADIQNGVLTVHVPRHESAVSSSSNHFCDVA